MDKRMKSGREFWRAVLLAGGATAIPRWTLDPAPGVAEHVATLDDDLAAAVRRVADGLEVPLHSVALAAHAKVLAALSGEQHVARSRTRRARRGRRGFRGAEHPILADMAELLHREHAPE